MVRRSYTKPAIGLLVGPSDAPDEVVDVRHYNRAMDALTNADALVTAIAAKASEPVRDLQHARQRLAQIARMAVNRASR